MNYFLDLQDAYRIMPPWNFENQSFSKHASKAF